MIEWKPSQSDECEDECYNFPLFFNPFHDSSTFICFPKHQNIEKPLQTSGSSISATETQNCALVLLESSRRSTSRCIMREHGYLYQRFVRTSEMTRLFLRAPLYTLGETEARGRVPMVHCTGRRKCTYVAHMRDT